MAICDPLSYGKLAGKCQRVVPDEDASAFWKIVCAINRIAPVLPAIPEGAIRPSRSDPVVVFLERFLNMFQNRFGIGFRYLAPLRLWLTGCRRSCSRFPGSPVSSSASMRFQSRVPTTVLCAVADERNRLRQSSCIHEQLGFSG